MTAIVCRPLPFTVGANSGWLSTNPVSNLNIDPHGMVARSSGNSASFTVNLGSTQVIDTVALIGSNLPASATVAISGPGFNFGSVPAFYGTKDASTTTKTIVQFGSQATASVTITITSNAPIEVQRLVIGKRVETIGIDLNTEQTFEDTSVVSSGPGYTTVEEYNVLTGWKVKMSLISNTKWREEFFPFFSRVGLKKAVLFVPVADDPSRFQHEAVFGRIVTQAKGEVSSSDNWIASFSITSLAP